MIAFVFLYDRIVGYIENIWLKNEDLPIIQGVWVPPLWYCLRWYRRWYSPAPYNTVWCFGPNSTPNRLWALTLTLALILGPKIVYIFISTLSSTLPSGCFISSSLCFLIHIHQYPCLERQDLSCILYGVRMVELFVLYCVIQFFSGRRCRYMPSVTYETRGPAQRVQIAPNSIETQHM